eukprot:1063946-Amphidinium_carterae.1
MGLPKSQAKWLIREFALPPVAAKFLHVNASPIGLNTMLSPWLKVLPMRWAWAVYFCQQVSVGIVKSLGFREELFVVDGSCTLVKREEDCVAIYVDNLGVLSHDAARGEA